MDQKIKDEAESIYELAKKAGIVTNFSFYDFISSERISEILQKISSDKDTKIVDELVWHLINFSIVHNKGVGLDWKFSARDVVFNIKQVLPELDITWLSEKQVEGNWTEYVSIEGLEYRFLVESGDLIHQVFEAVNSHISATGKTFVISSMGFDDIYYLLINSASLQEFEKLGFFSV